MSLQDVDNLDQALAEIARILLPGACACIAIVHPINSAGKFSTEDADSPFVIDASYLDSFRYVFPIERNGLSMDFHSDHRSLETYSRAIEKAGLLIEAIREPRVPDQAIHKDRDKRWQRLPLF